MKVVLFFLFDIALAASLLLSNISFADDQSTSLSTGLSDYDDCKRLCSNRKYISSTKQNKLAIALLSFPGSGNTWTRLLIEYSTGMPPDVL